MPLWQKGAQQPRLELIPPCLLYSWLLRMLRLSPEEL